MGTGRAERDLDRLLERMDPLLHPGSYVFASVARLPEGVEALATVAEPEGCSLICTRDQAEAAGLDYAFVAAWITLRVHSALEAVGLTAAVATRLAAAGLSCNVVAGYHHDHLFVPHEAGPRALSLLTGMARAAARGADEG